MFMVIQPSLSTFYNGDMNPYLWIDDHPQYEPVTQVATEFSASKVAAPMPLHGEGGHEVPEGDWTENGKHTANYNILAICQRNVTVRIGVDKPHREVAP